MSYHIILGVGIPLATISKTSLSLSGISMLLSSGLIRIGAAILK
jgi:hypothetical protein